MGRTSLFDRILGPTEEEASRAGRLVEVPLGLLDPHPENRRTKADVVARLAEEIERDGLGQPILVRAEGGGRYQVVSGHHRVAAYLTLAGREPGGRWGSIPAYARDDMDDETARRLLVATNLLVADLDDDERLAQYEYLFAGARRAMDEDPVAYFGREVSDVVAEALSERTGEKVSGTEVQRRRAALREGVEEADERELAALTREWREALESRPRAPRSLRRSLAGLPPERQREVYAGFAERLAARSATELPAIAWAEREARLALGAEEAGGNPAAGRQLQRAVNEIECLLGQVAQCYRYDEEGFFAAVERLRRSIDHIERF